MPGILDKHKNKNFVKRMFDNTKSIDKGNGDSATHLMSYTEHKGKYIMFPMIVEIDGKLKEFDEDKWKDAVDYALKNNEYIEFDNEKEAADFSKFGYKVESGMMSKEDVNNIKKKVMPKKQINIDNLKLGYVNKFDPKTQKPLGKAKLVSDEEKRKFIVKLKQISDKYEGLTPEDFLSVMIKENSLDKDGVLLLDQKSQSKTDGKSGRARGLIQFIPQTAKGLGLNQDDLATMTPSKQLDYVDAYFAEAPKGSLKQYSDLYMYTFQPAAMGKGNDYVIGEENSTDKSSAQRYKSNKALDKDNNGFITKGEFSNWSQRNIPSDSITNLFSDVSEKNYEKNYLNFANETSSDSDPKRPKYVFGENKEGKFVKVLTDNFPYREQQYNTYQLGENVDDVSIRKVGETDYISGGYIDDNGDVKRTYFEISKEVDKKRPSKTKNHITPKEMYKNEIMKQNHSVDGLKKGREIINSSLIDFPENSEESKELNFIFQKNYKIPYIVKDIKEAKEFAKKEVFDVQNEYANANSVDKARLEKKLKEVKDAYKNTSLKEKKISELYEQYKHKNIESEAISKSEKERETDIRLNQIYKSRPKTFGDTVEISKKLEPFDLQSISKKGDEINSLYEDIIKEDNYKRYKPEDVIKDELKPSTSWVDEWKNIKDGTISSSSSSSSKTVTPGSSAGVGGQFPEGKAGIVDNVAEAKSSDVDEDGNPIGRSDSYYDQQIKEIDEALAEQSEPEFEADLSGLKQQGKYDNLIGNAMDIGRGLLGAKGMLEEVPEYTPSENFQAYQQDSFNRRNMGLTPEEIAFSKNQIEKAFAFGNKNIIKGSGGSSGAYLAANQGLHKGMQDQYASLGARDSIARRENLNRFDRAAVYGEEVNRKIFEDKFKQSMLDKQAGAKLVSDSLKNIQEREDFERQHGEGSLENEYLKEMLKEKQELSHTLKQARKYQKERRKSELEKDKKYYQDKKKGN